jgi:hypothetical protein
MSGVDKGVVMMGESERGGDGKQGERGKGGKERGIWV